jgi:hypothetical protein
MARPKKYPDELIQRGVRLALGGERPIAHIAHDSGHAPGDAAQACAPGGGRLGRPARAAQQPGARGDPSAAQELIFRSITARRAMTLRASSARGGGAGGDRPRRVPVRGVVGLGERLHVRRRAAGDDHAVDEDPRDADLAWGERVSGRDLLDVDEHDSAGVFAAWAMRARRAWRLGAPSSRCRAGPPWSRAGTRRRSAAGDRTGAPRRRA